ncbi:hypothetical protein [Saccharophagus degradans]|uniref:Uncharacterized protein n=2 Tax=Saccharophagus degradans TaxID=86304 RepID=Q21IM4_SACD2|nr:hypothetical protein [Saccharophagus degradans]ABD81455.1 hypothetical protein Sde_2195 [Saccharophagus degradans 2-40]MBU2985855.1 hypothetical protein [Saccharophagus degradans]MDO6420994.1 hypothetical protein [Saccharophagus degradans]MDO6606095.1 hypothetical protein [Saccharophagus degradans]WGP00310.1 hypothetical protein QFX18_09655 [Saccharophagus degradans]
MNLVTASQFSLARTRKQLQEAFKSKDWQTIRDVDRLLAQSLNEAFDDSNRDTRALIEELERIVSIYGEMVACLPAHAGKLAGPRAE